jgi:EpsI family protein
MIGSLAAATWLTPRTTWYDKLGKPDYQALVPADFGDWAEDRNAGRALVVPAETTEKLNTIYSQVVSRIYIHKPSGRRLMLSLAYGDVQQGVRQLHRPESCYSSQGFTIGPLVLQTIDAAGRRLEVFRMTASAGGRTEQVTYWIRVGDRIITGPADELNFTRMELGLKGVVADGLLFRVSEIAASATDSDALQDRFIGDLVHAVDPKQLPAFLGGTPRS